VKGSIPRDSGQHIRLNCHMQM